MYLLVCCNGKSVNGIIYKEAWPQLFGVHPLLLHIIQYGFVVNNSSMSQVQANHLITLLAQILVIIETSVRQWGMQNWTKRGQQCLSGASELWAMKQNTK